MLNVRDGERHASHEVVDWLKQEGWRLRQLLDGYVGYLRSKKHADRYASAQETAQGAADFTREDDSQFSTYHFNQ